MDQEKIEMLKNMAEEAIDAVAEVAALFPSDSSDDIMARSMIAGMRPMIEAMPRSLEAEGTGNMIMTGLFVGHMMELMKTLEKLRAVSNLRGS